MLPLIPTAITVGLMMTLTVQMTTPTVAGQNMQVGVLTNAQDLLQLTEPPMVIDPKTGASHYVKPFPEQDMKDPSQNYGNNLANPYLTGKTLTTPLIAYFEAWEKLPAAEREKNFIYHKFFSDYLERIKLAVSPPVLGPDKEICTEFGCTVIKPNPEFEETDPDDEEWFFFFEDGELVNLSLYDPDKITLADVPEDWRANGGPNIRLLTFRREQKRNPWPEFSTNPQFYHHYEPLEIETRKVGKRREHIRLLEPGSKRILGPKVLPVEQARHDLSYQRAGFDPKAPNVKAAFHTRFLWEDPNRMGVNSRLIHKNGKLDVVVPSQGKDGNYTMVSVGTLGRSNGKPGIVEPDPIVVSPNGPDPSSFAPLINTPQYKALAWGDVHFGGFNGELCDDQSVGVFNYADKTPYTAGKRVNVGERLNVQHGVWKNNSKTSVIHAYALALLLPSKDTEDRFHFVPGKVPTLNGKNIAASATLQGLGDGVWYRYHSGMLTVITPSHQYNMLFHSGGYGNMDMFPMAMPHLNGGFPGGVLASTFEGRPFDKKLSHGSWTTGSNCSNKAVPGAFSNYRVKDGLWGNDYHDNRYIKNSPTPLRRKRDNWYPFIPGIQLSSGDTPHQQS